MAGPGHFRTEFLVLAVCLSGALVRVAIPGQDFFGPRPLPFSDDPPYHLLRVERLAASGCDSGQAAPSGWPDSVRWIDPMIAHPFGDQCIWPWGYDWLASLFIPGNSRCDRTCLLRIAGMLPVAVSLATALVVFLLARRMWRARHGTTSGGRDEDPLVPVTAAAFFLLMPGNVAYSLAGRFDHHVMEPLFIALPMLLVSGRAAGRMVRVGTGGLLLGLGAAFFPAAPAITFPLFVICGLFLADVREALIWCAAMIAGTVMSLFASPSPLDWVHYSPSLWHVAAVCCASVGLAAFQSARRASSNRRMWSGTAIGIGTAAGASAFLSAGVLSVFIFPGLASSMLDGIRYTMSADFAALSLEASSFVDDPLRMLSLSGWLLPLSAAGLFAVALPPPAGRRGGSGAFVMAGLVFIVLAAAQRRFLVAATPLIAVSAAFGLDFLLRCTGRDKTLGRGRTAGLIGILATLLMLVPSVHTTGGMKYLTPSDRAMYAAAEAISLSPGDERGTLAPWGYGHLFKYAAGAPTVCDNFFGVPGADAAMKRCLSLMYETDAASVEKAMEELRIRFVVLAPPHPDQIRVETSLLGLSSTDWVDADDRLSRLFADSFFGRTGLWASTAPVGSPGPWNLTLRGRFRQVDPSTRQVEAEVLLLERVPEEPR